MIDSVQVDLKAFESSRKDAEKVIRRLGEEPARKTMIEAGNSGLVNALRKHFSDREKEPHRTSGFPWFGQSYPKRYFWRGTRGTSVAEAIRITLSSPSRLAGQVSINSPALKHKLANNPPPIKPSGGKHYLAIPANPIAASWDGMPRDFPGGLSFAFSKLPDGHSLPSLVSSRAASSKGSAAPAPSGATPVYWLVRKVNTGHDPNALPPDHIQVASVTSAVRTAVQRILARPAPP